MAANAKDGFQKVLDRFRDTLTLEQQKDFEFSSLQHVRDSIKTIEKRYGPEKKLRSMRRLAKFLAGMKQVEELVTIFLNVHEVVAFVWGPVKFGLMIARNRLDTLEVLLDTYVEIGEVIPSMSQYEQLFKNYPYLKEILERCFEDILEFHKQALSFLEGPGWKRHLSYACNTFNTRCKPIIDSLRRHQDLLGHEKLTAAVAETQESRREIRDFRSAIMDEVRDLSQKLEAENERRFKKEAEESWKFLQDRRRIISSQLTPGDYGYDQRTALSRFKSSSLGDWVLEDPKFKEWLDSSNGPILYLHGMPGAGKTTLTSHIVSFLQSKKDTLKGPVLFFYFKSREDKKRSMDGMLRALLHQLIYQDEWAADYVRQKWESVSELEFKSLPVLQDLLQECLVLPRGGTIVLDGLDECQHGEDTFEEPEMIIDWIDQELISKARTQRYPVRVLVSSQRVDFLEDQLTRHPNIRLDHATGHLSSIHAYTKSEAIRIQDRFHLTESRREDIVKRVSDTANGFFLYARVVLDNLMRQGTKKKLDEELETDKFPKNLADAYQRVVVRVLDHGSRKKAALDVLTWMTCAARPLFWREIQSLFCISPKDGTFDPELWELDSYKTICGSLIEEDTPEQVEGEVGESVVRLVHNTAGGYLVETGRINLIKAHSEMALFCSEYLASSPFQDGPRAETIQEFAKTGYYGFLEHAMASWTHHLTLASKESTSLQADTISKLVSCSTRILESYEISKHESSGDELTSLEDILKLCPVGHRKSPFESRVSTIRDAIESIHVSELNDNARTNFLRSNGALCFKCPKQHCHNFTTGFSSRKGREDHINAHERPFKCSHSGCYRATIGYPCQSDLKTHARKCHPTPAPLPLFGSPRVTRPTTIFDACIQGDLSQVEDFLRQGVDVNTPSNPRGQMTPLVLAAKFQHYQLCQVLIERGADQVFSPEGRRSALDYAIKENDAELVLLLVHAATDTIKTQFLESGGLYSRILGQMKKHVNPGGKILQVLLDVYDQSQSRRRLHKPETLLYHVVGEEDSVSKFEVTLNWATSKSIHYRQRMSLEESIQPDYQSSAEERYALLTKQTNNKNSLLHVAASFGRLSITRHIVHYLKKDDIIATNDDGNTPLHIICGRFRTEKSDRIATMLVNADDGSAANMTNNHGSLPIKLACESDQESTVVLLATHTHDLNSQDLEGNTLLMCAVKKKMTKAVKALLGTKRVDVFTQNHQGDIASDLALRQEYTSVLRLLNSYEHASMI